MPEFFYFAFMDMSTTLIWVCFPNLHLEYWFSTRLSKIASVIGKPLQCDVLTNTMFRLFFVKVLIEVDLFVDLPNSINSNLPKGVFLLQYVVYESLLKFWKHCRHHRYIIIVCFKVVTTKGTKFPGNSYF